MTPASRSSAAPAEGARAAPADLPAAPRDRPPPREQAAQQEARELGADPSQAGQGKTSTHRPVCSGPATQGPLVGVGPHVVWQLVGTGQGTMSQRSRAAFDAARLLT